MLESEWVRLEVEFEGGSFSPKREVGVWGRVLTFCPCCSA